jgi:hypothetical protein
LGEPWYEHDFNNVEDSYDEFDVQAKIEGLHTVRRTVEYKQRRSILPGELWERYGPMSFWQANFEQKKLLNWVTEPLAVKNTQLSPAMQTQQRPTIPAIKRQL